MNIGLLGGTFDPVHNGHLALAQKAFDALQLEKIIFIPAFIPPHKEPQSITSASYRLYMLRLALEEYPFCAISDIEIKKQKKVFTIDTLRELGKQYADDTRLFFIVGSDFVHEYHTWKDPDTLTGLATFVIAPRPGFSVTTVPDGMQILEGNFPPLSSTDIRAKLQNGEDIGGLVPARVAAYIQQHSLYQS